MRGSAASQRQTLADTEHAALTSISLKCLFEQSQAKLTVW